MEVELDIVVEDGRGAVEGDFQSSKEHQGNEAQGDNFEEFV